MDFKREELSKEEYIEILFDLQQKWKNYHSGYAGLEKSEMIKRKKENSKSILSNKDNLENEDWCKYGENKAFEVSNFGRVKFNGRIVPQKEGEDGFLKLDKELFFKLYPNASRQYFEQNKVHDMVAKVYLGKITGEYMEIHHINDNEYDNSENNLILLTNTEHSVIHNKRVGSFRK